MSTEPAGGGPAVPLLSAARSSGPERVSAPPLAPSLAARPPYAQPLADPGRTGLAQRPLRLPLTRRLVLPLGPPGETDHPMLWLGAREVAPHLLGTTQFRLRSFDLGVFPSARDVRPHVTMATALPGGWIGTIDDGATLIPPPALAGGDGERGTGRTFCRGDPLAVRWSPGGVTALVQRWGCGHGVGCWDYSRLCQLKLVPGAKAPDGELLRLWTAKGRAAPSPFLPDGSVVVSREDELLFLDPTGKPGRRIAGRFLLGRVSAGEDGAVYAFDGEEGAVRLVVIRGEAVERLELGALTEPLQPPLLLPGGRVIVVTATALLSVSGKVMEWRWPVPRDSNVASLPRNRFSWDTAHPSRKWGLWLGQSGSPLATGTLDGSVVVRWGRDVVALDPAGQPSFELRVAGRITTNPVITSEGGVCVSHWQEEPAGNTLTCSLPP